jgi:hypothetical protein
LQDRAIVDATAARRIFSAQHFQLPAAADSMLA